MLAIQEKASIQKMHLTVGSLSDGQPIKIPVTVLKGKKDGPTLWLQGCIHGGEYGGAVSIMRVIDEIDLEKLNGTVIAVPVVNIPAFLSLTRNTPLDGENLNRIFPGDPNGTYSQQLAHSLLEKITNHADYFIDLHSGRIGATAPFYTIYVDDGSEFANKSRMLCEAAGSRYIWRIKGDSSLLGVSIAQALNSKIPSMTIEVGGGSKVTEIDIKNFTASTFNILKFVNMYEGETKLLKQYTFLGRSHFMYNHEGGIFIPTCKRGDLLRKGDQIGYIKNLFNEIVEEFYNPYNLGYIAAIRDEYWPSHPGELMAESLEVDS